MNQENPTPLTTVPDAVSDGTSALGNVTVPNTDPPSPAPTPAPVPPPPLPVVPSPTVAPPPPLPAPSPAPATNATPTKKQKVLFVITKGTWGGAQRYVFDLARSLPTALYEPVVAYGMPGQLSEELQRAQIRSYPVSTLVRDIMPTTDIVGFFDMVKCIKKERPDIVHLNSSKAGVLGALAAKYAGASRIVFTVHGWPFKEKRDFITRGILYFFSWLTAYLSDVVIVVSKTDLELGQKMSQIGGKIRYVPVGIDTPEYLPKEVALVELWKLVSSEKVPVEAMKILTIAELTPNKGVMYALDAILHLRRETDDNYVYIVMGSGEQLKSLEEFAKMHNLSDRVFFLGFIQNASVSMRAFDAFLLPSIKEGMPYVLLEAGESGIPIIATDVVNPEIKERYQNVELVRSENSLAIADALRKLRENPRVPLPASAPHFPLSEMVQHTIEAYTKS